MTSPRPRRPMSGVVLCGGRSARMGRDKALVEVRGRPLVLTVAEVMSGIADPVFLAPGTPGRLGNLGYPELDDARPGAGPLGGLVAALRARQRDLMAAVAVDMPFASPAVFLLLAGFHSGEDAVVPVTAEGLQPLHAVYAPTALPAMERALDEDRLGLRSLLASLRLREVGEDEWRAADPSGRFALNLNRADDLALLEPASGQTTAGTDVDLA